MAKKKATPKTDKETITVDDVGTLDPEVFQIKLPSGIDQDTYDKVKHIIVSGFKADQTPDAIKSAIFATGVPFSKLSVLYSLITKSEKLVVDPKIVIAAVRTALDNVDVTYEETYAELEALAATIAEPIQGCQPAKVLYVLKGIFKENEAEFPRKPATARGRMGIINKTIVNVFKKTPKATQAELYTALKEVTKTLKNADDYAKQYHKMAYALSNSLSANEALTVFAKETKE